MRSLRKGHSLAEQWYVSDIPMPKQGNLSCYNSLMCVECSSHFVQQPTRLAPHRLLNGSAPRAWCDYICTMNIRDCVDVCE